MTDILEQYKENKFYKIYKSLFKFEQQYNNTHKLSDSLFKKKALITIDLHNFTSEVTILDEDFDIMRVDYIKICNITDSTLVIETTSMPRFFMLLGELILEPDANETLYLMLSRRINISGLTYYGE